MGTQKPVHRAQPDGDPARDRKRAADFLQGQVGLLGNQLQHLRGVLAQPAATVAAHRARARMALGPPALRPASSAADTDIKPCRRRPCAAAQRHKTDHTLPQVLRVRSRHNRLQWHGPASASTISKGLKTPLFTCLPDQKPLCGVSTSFFAQTCGGSPLRAAPPLPSRTRCHAASSLGLHPPPGHLPRRTQPANPRCLLG